MTALADLDPYLAFLRRNAEIVAAWPEWKRDHDIYGMRRVRRPEFLDFGAGI